METTEAAFVLFGPLVAVSTLWVIVIAASLWKIFDKAHKPGWAAIVPVYNVLVMLEIGRKPWWWLVLMCIPGLNVIWILLTIHYMAKAFGKSVVFTVGIVLFSIVFLPILAFDESQYEDPNGDTPVFDY